MTKKLLIALLFLGVISANAQIKTPAPSPFSKITQVVGLTDVTLEYSRPAMRGRTIFGDLVPFDKIWIPPVPIRRWMVKPITPASRMIVVEQKVTVKIMVARL